MRAAVLFAGIGGWELAAEQIGIETAWAAEWDAWKADRYRERFPGVALYRDVRALHGEEMIAAHGRLDFLLGSPPCTDISSANHRATGVDGAASRHYFEAIRLVEEIRPRGCAFENSDKLRARGADRVLARLESIGYAAWPIVVGAVHAGAPHKRLRSFIVAADADQIGLRDQSRRRCGSGRQGTSVSAHDADANVYRQPLLPLYGEVAWSTGTDGANRGSAVDPDADQEQRRSRAAGKDRTQTGDVLCDPDRQRLAVGEGFGCHDATQQQTFERAMHGGWGDRSASLARHLRVADGVPAWLCGKWRSAFGDAVVVPVIGAVLRGLMAATETESA